jgi:hypothetical protein
VSDPIPPPTRKCRGCLFYFGLAFAALLLIGCLLGYLAVRFVKDQIDTYTDTSPMKLPKVEITDAEFQQLDQRVKLFADAVEHGKPAAPLVLTEQDINALIAKSGKTKDLADEVHVFLNDDEVRGQISFPLSKLGWIGRGRYLNGEATFNVSLENGVLIVTAKEIRVKGKALPESIMSQLRQENLAKEAYKDPKNAEAIRKLESIKVQDGQVIITARMGKQQAVRINVSPNGSNCERE